MSSPSSNADVGILAQNRSNSDADDASSASEETEFYTSRFDVYECFEGGTEFCGNCCYADIADVPSTVGLRISGVGNVPLPITDYHGNEVKKRAIIDDDEEMWSSGVYEIEAEKIKIQNPQWDESFKKLVETVAFKLGVDPSNLTAELDGLIYMEKGGYIGRCVNEEGDNVMGSLIIQLPSKFTGGALTFYNKVVEDENEEEGEVEEESFKFTLGVGEEAAYSCHFACHFADCEYEMAKLHSGSRVLLRYSLLYKQKSRNSIPTASLINEYTSPFEEKMNGLPPEDRMVLIPLEKEYDGISLGKSGIKALTRKHRQKAEALKAAGVEWELLIINAELVHNCEYGDHGNSTSIIEVFDESGSRLTGEMSWLEKTIDFHSIEHDDGMLLAFDDDNECVSNWGAYKSRSVDYEPEITYRSTFLVSYDPAFEMELKCLGGSKEVAQVCKEIVETRDYGLLDRLLSVVESTRRSNFDVNSCQILLQMLMKSRKSVDSLLALVNKIIFGLSSSAEPDKQLYNTIIDAVERLGHDELGNVIEDVWNDPIRKSGKDICFFLKRIEFSLKLNKQIKDGSGLSYLETAITDLSLSTRAPLDSAAAVTSIMDMISTYNDMDLSNVVQTCLYNLHRGFSCQYHVTLLDRAHLLKQLLDTEKFDFLRSSLVEFAADFSQRAQSLSPSTSERHLKGESKDKFVQAAAFIIEFGTQDDCDRFGKHILKNIDLFSAFIDAVMSVSGPDLLRDVLNKCLLQYSITDRDTAVRRWTVKISGEPDILPTPSVHVQRVLELYPNIVQTVDKDKRLPLYYAAASATASFDVTMEVFKAYKQAASIRDPVTGLFPFQLAASAGNIEASFSLHLANPNLVSSGIKVGDRKRKRSSSA